MGPWPLRYFRAPKQPKGARIVTFPGSPKPPDAAIGKWKGGAVSRTPWEHFKACLLHKGESSQNRWKRYLLPTDWVAEHWRE